MNTGKQGTGSVVLKKTGDSRQLGSMEKQLQVEPLDSRWDPSIPTLPEVQQASRLWESAAKMEGAGG